MSGHTYERVDDEITTTSSFEKTDDYSGSDYGDIPYIPPYSGPDYGDIPFIPPFIPPYTPPYHGDDRADGFQEIIQKCVKASAGKCRVDF
eukprot:Pgem_evm1s17074